MRKKLIYAIVFICAIGYCIACARGISPYEAANGKARCGRYIR